MFALTNFRSTAPPRVAESNRLAVDRVEARAARVERARFVGRWICAPDAQKPICVWEVDEIGSAGGQSRDWRRAA